MQKNWWKETFVYQIYPRSFRDSNGDGIGDIPGITQSLDYLKTLGVETIWLSPIYKSPNDDNGYDVADYCDIMDDFGTMDDFDEMLAEMKKRDIRLIMDLVVNHSSDEHRWFESAKKSKLSPYRDYYIWREGKPDGSPPNNWTSIFGGSAWEYNEATNDYYLHLFTKKQPDLNWENPFLRQEVYKLMRFWLDKGIDGYRMDVIPFISKRRGLPDIPFHEDVPEDLTQVNWYANGPRLHEFLHEMHENVMKHYDCMTVGEGIGVLPHQANLYVEPARRELDMIYHFDHMFADRNFETGGLIPTPWPKIKKIIDDWDKALPEEKGWNTFYLTNHDQPRPISRYGNAHSYRHKTATMLATLLFTQRATPYMYQGEEIGMSNFPFTSVDQFNDVWMINQYNERSPQGVADEVFVKQANEWSRDHARTPFQWNDQDQAGFTEGEPWMVVNPNYKEVNAEKAVSQAGSIFHFYRTMIALRKMHKGLIYGDFHDLTPNHEKVYAYTRKSEQGNYLVMLNVTERVQIFEWPVENSPKRLLQGNYDGRNYEGILRPFEALIYEM
ncbi:MAG: alpha-glucosidase [Bacteroidota bacterium]